MLKGNVVSLHIAPGNGQPMHSVAEAHAVPGRGLEGDRYSVKANDTRTLDPDREITFIESESFEALKREIGLDLNPSEGRRNIVTRGVALNHLVGQEFTVGIVKLRGHRLCEPCAHLQKISKQPAILSGLIHRGGLRAEILSDGIIRVGDVIEADIQTT